MEVLELIAALVQGCGCFLELMAVGGNVGAGVAAHPGKNKHECGDAQDLHVGAFLG